MPLGPTYQSWSGEAAQPWRLCGGWGGGGGSGMHCPAVPDLQGCMPPMPCAHRNCFGAAWSMCRMLAAAACPVDRYSPAAGDNDEIEEPTLARW